ncbi:MAG: hypothetical protein LBJ12_01125 [Oscillospiraceae bacterium]|nr:hypothetical protein [Oscillospiraceae bacterium]
MIVKNSAFDNAAVDDALGDNTLENGSITRRTLNTLRRNVGLRYGRVEVCS